MASHKQTVGDRIKDLREARSLTQAQLGEKLSVTDKTVSKWEKGKSEPDAESMVRIASFFGVTLDYLLTGATTTPKAETISKIELACREDNIALLNGVDLSIPDETGKDITFYAKKYDAHCILAYLEEIEFDRERKKKPVERRYLICALPDELDGDDNLVLLAKDVLKEDIANKCAEYEGHGYHGFRVFTHIDLTPAEFDYQTFCIDYLNVKGFRKMRIQYWMLDDKKSGLLTAQFYIDKPHKEKQTGPDGTEVEKEYTGYRYTADSYVSPKAMKEFMDLLARLDLHNWIDLPWGCPFCGAEYAMAGENLMLNVRHYFAPGKALYKEFVDGIRLLCMKSMNPRDFKHFTDEVSMVYEPHYRRGLPLSTSRPLFTEIEREGIRFYWDTPKLDDGDKKSE